MSSVLFHLAFPVRDIPTTKTYYVDGLGCSLGRENDQSAILNLYGHQLVAHVTPDEIAPQKGIYPRHFGLVFTDEAEWKALLDRAEQKHLKFYQQPKQRFPSTPLEHRTFFLIDPFGNLMEYKHYAHQGAIFGAQNSSQIGDREN
uniref:VOC family protein n=1 Tax=Leptolyngbya sp. NIES-2104 TaxID=1552121 RepID=UPI00073F9879|nr:VOC family protein [Leptolyngbya sp. NIES-2104]